MLKGKLVTATAVVLSLSIGIYRSVLDHLARSDGIDPR